MTRTRYRIFEDGHPYFMTCTIVGWLALFTRPEAVQIVFECWGLPKERERLSLVWLCRPGKSLARYRFRARIGRRHQEFQDVHGKADHRSLGSECGHSASETT